MRAGQGLRSRGAQGCARGAAGHFKLEMAGAEGWQPPAPACSTPNCPAVFLKQGLLPTLTILGRMQAQLVNPLAADPFLPWTVWAAGPALCPEGQRTTAHQPKLQACCGRRAPSPPGRCRAGRSEPPAGSSSRRCPPPPLRGGAGEDGAAVLWRECLFSAAQRAARLASGATPYRLRARNSKACSGQALPAPEVLTSRLRSPARKRRRMRLCSCVGQRGEGAGRGNEAWHV